MYLLAFYVLISIKSADQQTLKVVKFSIRSDILRTVCRLLLLCCGLLGCSKSFHFFDNDSKLPAGVENTTDESIVSLYEKLTSEKVKIITMGDKYLISIPSSVLFYYESPKIKWTAYGVLADVIAYLKSYRKIEVMVSAYTECYLSRDRTNALTRTRAKVVGDYLWSQDIGSRMLFTEGFGNDKPIVIWKGNICSDYSPNSRIEIAFKQVTA